MSTPNPCYLCEDRYSGCHSKCTKYKDWKAQHEKDNENARKAREQKYVVPSYSRKRYKLSQP